FFQAEDGIRDWSVTGVQTCALPICPALVLPRRRFRCGPAKSARAGAAARGRSSCQPEHWDEGVLFAGSRRILRVDQCPFSIGARSEERRVGKEGSGGRWAEE